jgi:hypothetical protein
MFHPQERNWLSGINKQTGFFLCVCTYCTHLAGFFKDDTSPWVLYSIHIQRALQSKNTKWSATVKVNSKTTKWSATVKVNSKKSLCAKRRRGQHLNKFMMILCVNLLQQPIYFQYGWGGGRPPLCGPWTLFSKAQIWHSSTRCLYVFYYRSWYCVIWSTIRSGPTLCSSPLTAICLSLTLVGIVHSKSV